MIIPHDYDHHEEPQKRCRWRYLLRPSAIAAYLAVVGRVIIGPIALVLLFTATNYLSHGTVLIKAEKSLFSFTPSDMTMAGGCSGCLSSCKIVLLKYALFNGSAFVSSPVFNAFVALGPEESLYNFSSLSPEALKLGKSLDTNGAVCQSGTNDWGATHNVVTGSARQILDVINILNLSVAPQMVRELELSVGRLDGCDTRWSMLALTRLFLSPTKVGDPHFGKLSAVDLNIFPDYTECRPVVTIDDTLVGSKLAKATNGEDYLKVVPESLTLFPYSFKSSLPPISRVVPARNTKYPATSVVQPLLRAYFGGCRVREVNTTGIFIEKQCKMSTHWKSYGLMVQSPDDIPLCTTGDMCVHNSFNSLWEWVNYISKDQPNRNGMIVNSFRSRYGDAIAIDPLPGIVVMQILIVGILSLYQAMSHKRSVLITQIWTYRCQNGMMQVVYLAQIIYHLVFNSDLYMLGLATGTLTSESIANLTCCVFAFSYSFINLVKARTGDQRLNRHYRLTWETMQLLTTVCVGLSLLSVQRTPIDSIIAKNSEILRKTSSRGAKYCGLHDSCILFTVNMAVVATILSLLLSFVAIGISCSKKRQSFTVKSSIISSARRWSTRPSLVWPSGFGSNPKMAKIEIIHFDTKQTAYQNSPSVNDIVTSFERNCLGGPFSKLFQDCDDIAYTRYNGKRCTTVEALLLTGYLFYGEHVYQAPSVILLVLARIIPERIVRTFNIVLIRWRLDSKTGTLSHALSCTWYHARKENHKLGGAMPVA